MFFLSSSVNVLLPARMVFAWTPDSFGYHHLWMTEREKTSFQFGIRTCNDALLALTQTYGYTSNGYEVVIGGFGGGKSVIRKPAQGTDRVEAETPDITHCEETRYFWVSWEGGAIEVGRGLVVGDRIFMRWVDPDPYAITAIGISGWNKENSWEFSHNEGKHNCYCSM